MKGLREGKSTAERETWSVVKSIRQVSSYVPCGPISNSTYQQQPPQRVVGNSASTSFYRLQPVRDALMLGTPQIRASAATSSGGGGTYDNRLCTTICIQGLWAV